LAQIRVNFAVATMGDFLISGGQYNSIPMGQWSIFSCPALTVQPVLEAAMRQL
jgi:hypothetical protein